MELGSFFNHMLIETINIVPLFGLMQKSWKDPTSIISRVLMHKSHCDILTFQYQQIIIAWKISTSF